MTNPIGILVIGCIIGCVLGYSVSGEFFNKKTYVTVFFLALFIDIFMGSFPFYTWDVMYELPVSGIYIASLVGMLVGKALGGR
jgi:hypothetical protein